MFLFNIWISIPNGGLTNFSPLIVKGLGYSSQRSALLTIPNGVVQTASSYMCNGGVFLAAKYLPQYHFRGVFIMFGIIVGLIAAVFLYTLPLDALHSRLAALYMSFFYLGPYIVGLSLVGANTAVRLIAAHPPHIAHSRIKILMTVFYRAIPRKSPSTP